MNIIFKTLEIDNFQSIGHAKIELDERGTTIIKGINNYEENTDSNGSGKSSIFEALYFSLFGKTTTGLTNVSNRYTGKDYKISLEFILDDVTYKIIRNGTKVTLLQNDEDISRRNKSDTDTFIKDNILKVSPEIFLNIIYLAQGFKSRLSALTAGGRKDQIEEIIGTSEITESFRVQVQELKEKLNNELNEANNKISYNNGTINQININKDNYQKEINRILEERKNQPSKEDLTNKINELNKENESLENNKKEINEKIDKIKEENSSKEKEVLTIENEINQLSLKATEKTTVLNTEIYNKSLEIEKDSNEKISKLNEEIAKINNEVSASLVQKSNNERKLKENKRQIETLKTSDTCPTCGRKFDNVNQEHLINEIQKYINENIELQKQIDDISNISLEKDKQVQNLRDQVQEIKSNLLNEKSEAIKPYQDKIKEISDTLAIDISNKDKEREEVKKTIKSVDTEIGTLKSIDLRINQNKANILSIQDQINEIKEESTESYEKLIKDCDKEIVKSMKENEKLQKSCNELEEKIGVATHSISLISREFKNYLLKSAIDFLNNRLEYYSSQLFSNDSDKVKFIQDGNKLDIYLGDAVFESLSGGEKRKVDIIIMLAQKELASGMSNTYSNILILDEVFDGLDSKSIDITSNMLLSVSKDINSMFIVSHKDTVIGHDGLIIVTKGKDRISTVVQQ